MRAVKFCAKSWPTFRCSSTATTYRASRKCKPRSTTSSARLWRCWPVAKLELYGAARCPHTSEMREWLEWKRSDFVEYDVEADPEARARMRAIAGGQRTVPLLVEDSKVVQVGWQGRGCIVDLE